MTATIQAMPPEMTRPTRIARAIQRNTDRWWNDRQSYESFGARARRLWSLARTPAEDLAVCAVLRDDPSDALNVLREAVQS